MRTNVSRPVRTANGGTFSLRDGSLVGSSNGVTYRVENMTRGGFTLRHANPRARGKAARRAEKAERRRDREQREHNERLELRRHERQAVAELEA